VADAIAAKARLIAFDEMIVTNSADAMVLSRLFTRIIGLGVTVVATSNRPPQYLYKNGLNREHFLPFIAILKDRLDVLSLDGQPTTACSVLAASRHGMHPTGVDRLQAVRSYQ
jgi:cell division protein ZapE